MGEYDNIKDFIPLVQKYLAISATNCQSEWLFSTAGDIITENRSTIDSENVDILLFLNRNSKKKVVNRCYYYCYLFQRNYTVKHNIAYCLFSLHNKQTKLLCIDSQYLLNTTILSTIQYSEYCSSITLSLIHI